MFNIFKPKVQPHVWGKWSDVDTEMTEVRTQSYSILGEHTTRTWTENTQVRHCSLCNLYQTSEEFNQKGSTQCLT